MCWNFEVSISFAIFEAISIGFIFWRSRKSADPWIQAQIYVLPMLISICLVEFTEALIWLDKDNLISVTAGVKEGEERISTCSRYNSRLTAFFFLCIGPFQPYFFIFPLRRVGPVRNRDLFFLSEFSALFLAASVIATFMSENFKVAVNVFLQNKYDTFGSFIEDFLNAPLSRPPRSVIQYFNYKLFNNSETCSYIGLKGHLLWTFAFPVHWTVANEFPYMMLCATVAFGRPYKFASGIFLTMGILIGFPVYFYVNETVEFLTIWCWLGVTCNIYFILQPYIFPCTLEVDGHPFIDNSKQEETIIDHNKTNGNQILHHEKKS